MAEEVVFSKQSEDLIGKMIADRYEIMSLVGEGGMGLVYKARHVLMNRLVAIKMIRAEHFTNQTLLQRFQQEAMAISKLQHPNIVSVYDFGVAEGGAPYLVMDYLHGTSLADLLASEGKMSLDRSMPLFIQACEALKHAHDKGIIHRDFKASNLMICSTPDGQETVKIVDFGMAKLLRPEEEGQHIQELTQTGEVFGSPLYMSPEQCKGQKLDERSDIYSLACCIYFALTGRPPFLGDNVLDTLQKQIHDEAVPVLEYVSVVPDGVNSIILKALRKDPDERYQNVGEMLADLEAVKRGEQPAPVAKRKKKRMLLSHNFESNIIFISIIGFVVALMAFMSGRMFEVADETQEMNMWVDRNLDGDKARARGNLPAAEKCYQEAIVEAIKFGKNDPRLARTLESLGLTYLDDKQYTRAETTLKHALTILETCYGEDSFETTKVMLSLARAYEETGRDDDAEGLRKRAMQAMETTVGRSRQKIRKVSDTTTKN